MEVAQLISPIDQPSDALRLRSIIEKYLDDSDSYQEFIFAVAYAKSGILQQLKPRFDNWKNKGNRLKALVGIDQKITSHEALQFLLENFDEAKVINHKATTFHPKVFIFKGVNKAVVIIGSNNLTFGGLEQNFESAAVIEYDLGIEKDNEDLNLFYSQLLQLEADENGIAIDITKENIEALKANKLLASETRIPGTPSAQQENFRRHSILNELFASTLQVKGRSKKVLKQTDAEHKEQDPEIVEQADTATETEQQPDDAASVTGSYQSFYIQINPHHNGEVFLSKQAVNEKPDFFDFPFTGLTTPKEGSNKKPYPQRIPDPVVNIVVFGKDNVELLKLSKYDLNTVFYESKKEIRITCSQLVKIVPEYSLLIMSKPLFNSDIDYEMIIHTPESPFYDENLEMCTSKMPTGGAKYKDGTLKGQKKPARMYGWPEASC